MSWQANFHVRVFNCSSENVRILETSQLRQALHEACMNVIRGAGVQGPVTLSAPECVSIN
jgi:hypothetical protein